MSLRIVSRVHEKAGVVILDLVGTFFGDGKDPETFRTTLETECGRGHTNVILCLDRLQEMGVTLMEKFQRGCNIVTGGSRGRLVIAGGNADVLEMLKESEKIYSPIPWYENELAALKSFRQPNST